MHAFSLRSFARLIALLLVAGCAASVKHMPENLIVDDSTSEADGFSLGHQVQVSPASGSQRVLKAGSQWRRAGKISHGDVYKPYNGIFTLEGADVHEAWLVVVDRRLVGFYLPVERGFTPIATVVELPLSSTRKTRE